METKSLDDLQPDPKNPRRMGDHDGNALDNSMSKFGDLSCVVFNVRTKQMVGGHQRVKLMKRLPERHIEITQGAEPGQTLDDVGTTALGYILIGKKRFAYREVDWDMSVQHAANIAANRIQGEFDLDLLSEMNYELAQADPQLLIDTGQTEDEIKQLAAMSGFGEPDPKDAPGEGRMMLRIECDNDAQMTELYTELTQRGLKVKM